MSEHKVTISLDSESWDLLKRFAGQLGRTPEDWIESLVRQTLGHPGSADMDVLAERVRRLDAPVLSWPMMELDLMRASLGRE